MKNKTFLNVMLLSVLLFSCSKEKKVEKVDAIHVETETATLESSVGMRTFVGEVEALSSTAVSFSGSGTVLRVLVSDGMHVKKGELVAEMDPTQCQNGVMAAEALMMQAQDAYDRMKILHDRKSISEMDWVEVQSKVQQAKSSLEMARKALADCQLKAPCSGVVEKKLIQAGMTALPAQPVCNILDISSVNVKISVPEKELASVSHTASISVDALAGKTFQSCGFEKGVVGDEMSHTYGVNYRVNNSKEELLPGMVCNVLIHATDAGTTSSAKSAITVPIRCVQQGSDGCQFVWTVNEGKACRTKVALGATIGNRIVIASGLQEGAKVITAGYQKVSEGAKVK